MSSAVTALKETIAKAKADSEAILAAAQAEWTELNANVPPLVDAIQGRVDTLTKSHKLPKDVDKATFETIKTDFETVKTDWASATGNSLRARPRTRYARGAQPGPRPKRFTPGWA